MRMFAVAVAIVVGLAGVAGAQGEMDVEGPITQPQAPAQSGTETAPVQDGGAVPGARREPGKPEMMYSKPSGFGLPNIPAKGGAYRYRLLLVGVGVMILTLLLTVRYLRKVARARPTTAA